MAGPSKAPQTLPKTIEEATRRYILHYENNFSGRAEEMIRLSRYAESKIVRLRKKAPKFYQDKLPILVNQAASALLACDTTTQTGLKKFHETHGNFLRILDELTRSQPPGEVDFQTERERAQERDRLLNQQIKLRTEIEKLEATEFDVDDIGEDEADLEYAKVFDNIDKKKQELKRVSILIAKMEGHNIDSEEPFELRTEKGSLLERLTADELKNLEKQIQEFLDEHKNQKSDFCVDISIVDKMLANLDLGNRFQNQDMRQLSKELLEAYRKFYRDQEKEWREDYFKHLCTNKTLRPKEGYILSGPDDVPEHVKQELERTDACYKRKLEDQLEEFTKRTCFDEHVKDLGESVDQTPSDDEEEDGYIDHNARIIKEIEDMGHIFARVKEEPRDDYNNEAPSDDELLVNGTIGDMLESEEMIDVDEDLTTMVKRSKLKSRMPAIIDARRREEQAEALRRSLINNNESSSANGRNDSSSNILDMSVSQDEDDDDDDDDDDDEDLNNNNDDDDDDDIECLGVVEPTDKIPTLDLE